MALMQSSEVQRSISLSHSMSFTCGGSRRRRFIYLLNIFFPVFDKIFYLYRRREWDDGGRTTSSKRQCIKPITMIIIRQILWPRYDTSHDCFLRAIPRTTKLMNKAQHHPESHPPCAAFPCPRPWWEPWSRPGTWRAAWHTPAGGSSPAGNDNRSYCKSM